MKLKDILDMGQPVLASRRSDEAPYLRDVQLEPEDMDADDWEYSLDGKTWFDGDTRAEFLKPVDPETGRTALEIPGSGCRVLDKKEEE